MKNSEENFENWNSRVKVARPDREGKIAWLYATLHARGILGLPNSEIYTTEYDIKPLQDFPPRISTSLFLKCYKRQSKSPKKSKKYEIVEKSYYIELKSQN